MKKNILLGALSFSLISCTQVNSNGEKSITHGEDTVSEVNISLNKYDAISELADIKDPEELQFRASGTEPGWMAEFYNNKLRLVVDYGKDSLIMENQKFEDLDNKDGFVFIVQGDKDTNKNVGIKIVNASCVAPGNGNKEDRTVVVTYKGKTYKGCGSFIK